MKKLIILLIALSLIGCASVTYKKSPDGTEEATYSRLFTTSDAISADLKTGRIESQGQKIDAALLQQILQVLMSVK